MPWPIWTPGSRRIESNRSTRNERTSLPEFSTASDLVIADLASEAELAERVAVLERSANLRDQELAVMTERAIVAEADRDTYRTLLSLGLTELVSLQQYARRLEYRLNKQVDRG